MKDDKAFINHIIDEVNYLTKETKGLAFEKLLIDETLKRAILRSLEIIGEAAKNISDDYKNKHVNIPWKEMAGLRDKLIHFYFGVDWNVVWDVIKDRIPKLKRNLEKIVSE